MNVVERFFKYVSFDTQSSFESDEYPSTSKQKLFGEYLVDELISLGVTNAAIDRFGCVTGSIPGNVADTPVLGLLAHMDTSPDMKGGDVKPRIVKCYNGGDIVLNKEKNIVMSPTLFTDLMKYYGHDLIVTGGDTLLGADNKAGIAEIMTMAEILLTDHDISHGEIRIAFTPDEEIGKGTIHFDPKQFGADIAYTVDGGEPGEVSYENFNAAAAIVTIQGRSVHPGSAKDKMLNASLIAMQFQSMLPQWEAPQHTEGYEGFFHLTDFKGSVDHAVLKYIIRDHSESIFSRRKKRLLEISDYLNRFYGAGTVAIEVTDSYRNMISKIQSKMYLIENTIRAMEELNMVPIIRPIRGGTDGARLSWMGLPCPNICCGGHYAHGPYEFISVKSLEDISRLLVKLTEKTVKK